jgi:hypothetical protein
MKPGRTLANAFVSLKSTWDDESTMRQSFGELLWSSFKAVYGPVGAAGAFAVALLTFIFADVSVPLRLLIAGMVLIFLLMLLLIFGSLNAAYKAHKGAAHQLPRVLQGMDPFAGMSAVLMCYLEPSELFSHGIAVAFYNVNPQGFEVLVGIGTVINVQDDGKIQVAMTSSITGHEDFVNQLRQNNAEALRTTRVKPSVPWGYPSFYL